MVLPCVLFSPAAAAVPQPVRGGPSGAAALEWQPCEDPAQQGFDRATLEVPLDYDRPAGETIDLALIRHKATGPSERIGSLFFNPGGPGGSGTAALPLWYERFFPAGPRERFDVVSWDPRGIGRSTAVRCFADAEEAAAWWARQPAGFPVGEKERQAWYAGRAELADGCRKRAAKLLPHLSTPDGARDLDRLRDAVGDRHLRRGVQGDGRPHRVRVAGRDVMAEQEGTCLVRAVHGVTVWRRSQRVGVLVLQAVPMARRPQVQIGTTGGCLFNGVIALCVLLLVTVVSAWIWLATQPERDETKARADLRENVETRRQRLARAAADGVLQDAEIAQLFPPTQSTEGLADIKRQGESITVIAEMLGIGPPRSFIFVNETTAEGCYAFHVLPPAHGAPRVSVRQLSDETCTAGTASTPPSALTR
ncbi:hypothetical protein ACFYQA_16310 [Streptomyces sp. NPDC005774]|uniref:hypothetical protein n=1 Tax=Streptomyces sp. NPDC005774 TaxID=3364728 RepID=UPI00368AB012